jgi:ribosomal protein S18 acetylase RimI-like enzyme
VLPLIRELEECVVDGWPAAETVEFDGWVLRATGGFTHRGNSVATVSPTLIGKPASSDVDERVALALRIARVEAWYAGHGLPPMFQVGPASAPAELEQTLEERGYQRTGEALLALATPDELLAVMTHKHGFEVSIASSASPAWLELGVQAGRLGAYPAPYHGVLRRLGSRCRFVLARDAKGTPVASCLVVNAEERLAVHSMLTLPTARRRGAARAMLQALARTARGEATRELYLLVETDNEPARALYTKCGFRELYTYQYRVLSSEHTAPR